jgi:hypothetical protein
VISSSVVPADERAQWDDATEGEYDALPTPLE